ncbi:histidine kinase [Halorarum halophilum]|uniref:histidine kinase n=1 Tax=Halorarum halophilum TaxID=2743090 RepID=A0A7D5GX37_9EURY|nr:ATP-binding protein [Halobaculum halophilum]QLG27449.1 histidine kinase [Halobaculum halophilum]
MAPSNRLLPAVGGRRLVGALGGFYVVLAAGYPIVPGAVTPSLTFHLVVGVLVGGPGLVLLYGCYRLPRTEIRPELFPTVARWCLGGIGVVLGVLLLTALAADLTNLVTNVLILTALGSVAGFVAGVYNARAKTRERDLRETVEQLRKSNERLEQFAYAASHDLQEPLRMVSSYLQLLENRYEDELDEEAREFIGFAVGGADRMRVMVERLLEYSRVTNSGDPLEPTDTGAVLRDIRENLRLLIEETGTTITADELPTVSGDSAQLALVFQNLLSNAVKHSGEESPTVHVSAERVDDTWRFSVTDDGIGIAPEYHGRIFEVFQQLHRDEELETDTVGIGLALCERIVERHGGKMWVESDHSEGAAFYFTIPDGHEREPTLLDQSLAST